jgi:hypothetical protein
MLASAGTKYRKNAFSTVLKYSPRSDYEVFKNSYQSSEEKVNKEKNTTHLGMQDLIFNSKAYKLFVHKLVSRLH